LRCPVWASHDVSASEELDPLAEERRRCRRTETADLLQRGSAWIGSALGQDKRADVVHLTLSRDETTSFQAAAFSVAIRWNGVKDGGDETAVEGCTQCCMTCGETTVCACFVKAPCGRCCCDLCCAVLDGVIRDPRF
jgi:hypothetical protein